MMKGVSVLGCPTAIATVADPALRPPRLAKILAWAASGAITPVVSSAYPLAEFRTAMLAKWNGEVVGGCVLHP
jgi:NADPH2:quinone reductase